MSTETPPRRYWRHHRDPECFLLTDSPLVAAPWQEVVVMTPAELAAHDEQVRADERERIAKAIEARRGVGYVSTSACEFADGARAALTAAAEIARTGSGEAT